MKRCINIDWLEIYCLEPIAQPHTPDWYRARGLNVEEREYGTRVYKQMFKILDNYGNDLLEIRREPKGEGREFTVLPINACHIRLTNRLCYSDNAVAILVDFCKTYSIQVERIFRIDIALDFERFDSGDDPGKFVMRYIKRKYSKINQAEGHGHFTDRWDGRCWNSLSWGSPKSAVGTKLYNKTKELQEVRDKPYIRQAWFLAGLIDDPQKKTKKREDRSEYSPVIWRLEFSIRSAVKNWLTYEKDGNPKQLRSVRNTPQMYDSREKLLAMFALLQNHYFHFRKFIEGKSKYDCPRKELFKFAVSDTVYKVQHPSSGLQPDTLEQRLLKYLQQYALINQSAEVKTSINTLLNTLEKHDMRRLLENPWSNAQLVALQQTIARRLRGVEQDPVEMMRDIQSFFEDALKPF